MPAGSRAPLRGADRGVRSFPPPATSCWCAAPSRSRCSSRPASPPKNRGLASLRETPIRPKAEGGSYLVTYDPAIIRSEPDKKQVIDWDVRLAVRLLTTGALDPVLGTYRWVGGFSELIGAINCTSAATGEPVDLLATLGAGCVRASRSTCSRMWRKLLAQARHEGQPGTRVNPAQVALCLVDLAYPQAQRPRDGRLRRVPARTGRYRYLSQHRATQPARRSSPHRPSGVTPARVVVLRPEDIRGNWTRQALIKEADRPYGRRPGGR